MRDLANLKAWQKLRRDSYIAKKYGPEFVSRSMGGHHGNHAHGERNGKWRGGRFITSQGYVAVRVPPDHPHAWGAHPTCRYAYEHILIAEKELGRPLAENEMVHHDNEIRTDNRWPENLKLTTFSDHGREHAIRRGRDELGRFPPRNQMVKRLL